MIVLLYDAYEDRHRTFVANMLSVPGKHVIVHTTNFLESKKALQEHEFDLVSIDDQQGDTGLARYLVNMPGKFRPPVVNIHSWAVFEADKLAQCLVGAVDIWRYLLPNRLLYLRLKDTFL